MSYDWLDDADLDGDPGEEKASRQPRISVGKRTLVNQVYGNPGKERALRRPRITPGKRTPVGRFGRNPTAPILRTASGQPVRGDAAARLEAASEESGQPLPAPLIDRFERTLGNDFGDVRVHTGARADRAAQALGARAFAHGKDIHFAAGSYRPETDAGARLLAHEVAHTAQAGAATADPVLSSPGDAVERDADAAADAVMTGQPTRVSATAAGGVIGREESGEEPKKLDYHEYLERYGDRIAAGVSAAVKSMSLETQCVFTSWKSGPQAFLTAVAGILGNDWHTLMAALPLLCEPESPVAAINRGRSADSDGKSEDVYEDAVATEIKNIIARRLVESMARLMPRYAQATNQALLSFQGPLREPLDLNNPPEPAANDIVQSAPVDKVAVPALMGNVKVDLKNYQTAHPDEKAAPPPRSVNYMFVAQKAECGPGANLVQVTDTCDPPVTAEDVAFSIFGDSCFASYLTPAPPVFGFIHPEQLIRYEEWKKLPGNDGSTDPENPDASKADPAKQIITGAGGEQAALDQAKGSPGTGKGTKDAVAQRMVTMISLVDAIMADAGGIAGVTTGDLGALKSRLDQRKKQVEATEETASGQQNPWDAQSAQQLDILGSCASGASTAARHWAGLTAKGGGKQAPPNFFSDPIKNLATAFVEAASVSDLVSTGRQRLALANQRLRTYPIDVTEGILSYVRQLLREADQTIFHGAGAFAVHTTGQDIGDLSHKEEDLRKRCSALRDLVVSDPGKAQAELADIQKELGELQLYSTVVTLVAKGADLDNTLENLSHSFGANKDFSKLRHPFDKSKQTGSKQQKYEAAQGEISYLKFQLESKVLKPAKAGDLKTAQANLSGVQGQYQEMFPRVAKLVDDEETKAKWIKIGVLIGVGVLSAGFGDAVAAVGAADLELSGGTLFALKTGAEAAAFTTLTTTTLEEDPTLQGVIGDFFKNWATMAMVGKAMESYKAALPAFAGTFKGQVVGGIGMFVAHCSAGVAAADAKRFLATGQHLSEEEIKETVEEGVLVTIGTMIGERVTHHFLHGVHFTSAELKGKIDHINAERDATKAAAGKLKAGAKPAAAQAVIRKDGATIAEEKAVVDEIDTAAEKDPASARAMGLSDEDIATIKGMKGSLDAAAEQNKMLQLLAGLRNLGGDTFSAQGAARFDEVVRQQREAGNQVSISKDPDTKQRTAVVTTKKGGTVRVVEDLTEGAVTAKPEEPTPSAAEQEGTAAATAQRAAEKTYHQQKSSLLGSLKRDGDRFKIDGNTPSLGEVVQRMRELGWQTMEIVEGDEVTLPDGRKAKPRSARFEAHPDSSASKAPFEDGVQVVRVVEAEPPTGKAKQVTPEQWNAAKAAIQARAVPSTADLPATGGNIEGTVKLEKVNRDGFLQSERADLVARFYRELSAKLDGLKEAPEDLNAVIQGVMNARNSKGEPIYLMQGPELTKTDANAMGELARGVNFESLAGNKSITQAYYDRLRALPENDKSWALPEHLADVNYGKHASHIGELMKILPPDPMTDLDGGGPIGRGASPGWWGAAQDSGVPSPMPNEIAAPAYSKAVAAGNLADGGVLFGMTPDQAMGGAVDATGAKVVARRPTAFDGLWQTQFNPNPDAEATYGLTTPDPADPHAKPVREVIMGTVNISQAKTRILIK